MIDNKINESRIERIIKRNNALAILLPLFYMAEASTKVLKYYNFEFINISAVVKILFICISTYIIITERNRKLIVFLIIILLIFFLGQFSYNDWRIDVDTLFSNSVYLGRFLFVFFIIAIFDSYKQSFSHTTFKMLEMILILNSLLVIIGAIGGIDLFRTYKFRFGYNGLFMTPTVISYFNAIGLIYFSRKILLEKKGYMPALIIICASLLAGTKGILFFLALTSAYFILLFKIHKRPLFYLGLLIASLLILIFRFQFFSFLKAQYSTIYTVYVNDGFLSMITSYRNLNFNEVYKEVILNKWNGFNFLFGGTDFDAYRIEFDVLDLFLFFGIIGGGYYLWFYFSNIIKFRLLDSFSVFHITFLLLTGVLAGTFFNSGPIAIYIVLIINYLYFKPSWK